MDCRPCEHCGTEFEPITSGKQTAQRFCSRKCRNTAAELRLKARNPEEIKIPAEKACGRCHVVKPGSEYQRNPRTPSGLNSWCKQCMNEGKVAWKTRKRAERTGAKVCYVCERSRPLSEFNPNSMCEDGYADKCRDCVGRKRCNRCGQIKPLDAFTTQKSLSDGTANTCKACAAVRNAELHEQNREAKSAKRRERYANDPKYRQRAQNAARRGYYANYAKSRESRQRYYEEHREEAREYQAKRYREQVALIQRKKTERGCRLCHEFHPACLDFHHRDPSEKLFNIGEANVRGRYTMEEVEEEIRKCDVLCRNCHAKLHWEERQGFDKMKQADLPL